MLCVVFSFFVSPEPGEGAKKDSTLVWRTMQKQNPHYTSGEVQIQPALFCEVAAKPTKYSAGLRESLFWFDAFFFFFSFCAGVAWLSSARGAILFLFGTRAFLQSIQFNQQSLLLFLFPH